MQADSFLNVIYLQLAEPLAEADIHESLASAYVASAYVACEGAALVWCLGTVWSTPIVLLLVGGGV